MEELDLKELMQSMWENKIKIIIITVIFAIVGGIYGTYFITPRYKSSAKLLLGANIFAEEKLEEADFLRELEVIFNSNYVPTYVEIIKSNKIMKNVISNLSLKIGEGALRNSITVTNATNTKVINITVTNSDPILAAQIANEVANVFMENVKEFYGFENVQIIDEAKAASYPYNINNTKYILIFAAVGLIISTLYVFIMDIINTKVRNEENIEKITESQVLATIPLCKESKETDKIHIPEKIRTLKTKIQIINLNKATKTLLITSTNQGEGKSWIASNLATAFSQTGKKVILIDADMSKGGLHEIFNVKQKPGLSNYLLEAKSNNEKDNINKILRKTDKQNLHLIPSGEISENSSELLLKPEMELLLEKLKQDNDLIIIDGTSSKLVSDSIILSKMVDSTLLVVGHKTTKEEDLKKVVKDIKNVGGNILGVVYNKK